MSGALGTLLPASWRGNVFGVYEIRNRFGRRTALHEYLYKDSVWVEDLGSGLKRFSFTGFLAGPLAAVQHAALALAMNTPGTGTLIHPGLGTFTGVVVDFETRQSRSFVNGFDLSFTFVESADPEFPASEADTIGGVNLASANVFSAAGTSFGSALGVAGMALGIVTAAPAVIGNLVALPLALAADAGAIANSVTSIGDVFGPYATQSGTAVTLDEAAAARAAVVAAAAAATAAGESGDPAAIQSTVAALPGAVAAAATDPIDQVRLLLPLSAAQSTLITAADAIGQAQASVGAAIAALFRRAALAALGTAEAAALPASYDDAMALLTQITAAIDAEITIAGDLGDDAVLAPLRDLRAAVVADLTARGASLAPLRNVTSWASVPALAWAQRLYRDGTRSDELIRRVQPWHPAFMPLSMTVLAA